MARGLNVERIVAAAIELADEDGLAAVSMARVAERLGFTTMSLYRHVASKDELVWRMLDRALGPAPEFEIPDWRTGLERWAHEMRALLLRHPWGIDIPITGVLATASQLSWLNRGLEALDGTGLAPGEDADLVLLVNGYVFWAVRLEVSLAAAPPAPLIAAGARPRGAPLPAAGARGGRVRGRVHARPELPVRPRPRAGRHRGADRAPRVG